MGGLLRNITWLGLANAAVKPLWFVFITAFCMRLLGVDGYGVMSAALALSMMGASFTDLGMARYTVRGVARDHGAGSLYFSNLFSLRIVLILVATAVVLMVALLLGYRSDAFVTVVFACTYTLFLTLMDYVRSMYEAFERLRVQAAMLVLEKILVVSGGLLLLTTTRKPHWTLAGMTAGMAVTALVNVRWVSRNLAAFRLHLTSREFLVRTLRSMIILGLGGLFFALYFRIDLVLVEAILSEREAGQYGAAYRILEALNMIPTIIVISGLYPRLSRLLGEQAFPDFRRVVRIGQLGLAAITISFAVVLSMWGPELIRLLDPEPEFAASGTVLQLLAWVLPLLGMNGLLYSALIAMDDDAASALILGGAAVFKTLLDLWLIEGNGIMGAAQASIATEVALLVAFALRYMIRSRRRRNPLGHGRAGASS